MQTDQIETFLDLVETRSFNRTAERMGITQSTVSGRIRALEDAVGASLFSRSRAGTQLTTEGLKFEAHARALRHAWAEAKRALEGTGTAALHLRIGIQNDLAAGHIGDWLDQFRRALPQCAFYIEPDYSNQMCIDLASGQLDFAVMYTPRALPDLHFTSLGDASYRLISTDGASRRDLVPERYIFGNYAPAFDHAHRQILPEMTGAMLASGQNSAVTSLLTTVGGAAFVLEETAETLIGTGRFFAVSDVPAIRQPVYAATHLRHRTSALHRRLLGIVQRHFSRR